MSGEDFTVDLAGLGEVVADLEACERDLAMLLGDLDRQVAVLHGTWSGVAASAQEDAHRRWAEGAAAMHAALGGLRAAARAAHGHYSRAAATNVEMWRQIS